MPGPPIRCPSCGVPLRTSARLAPGTSIRCPQCDVAFRHAETAVRPPPSWDASEPEARAARPADEERDQPGVGEKIGDIAGQAGQKAGDMAGGAGQKVGDLAGTVGEKAGQAGEAVGNIAGQAGEKVGNIAGQAGETVGGVVRACLPSRGRRS